MYRISWRLSVVCLLICFALFSCVMKGQTVKGSGILEKRIIHYMDDGIQGIKFSGIGTLKVISGDAMVLRVSAENNIQPYLRQFLDGGVLRLDTMDQANLSPSQPIVYELTLPSKIFEWIVVSGSVKVDLEQVKTHRLMAVISGSGNLDLLGLQCEVLECEISGSGSVSAQGKIKELDLTVSGSGHFKGHELLSKRSVVKLKGSGSAEIFASEEVLAQVRGSGLLVCYGTPSQKEVSVSGSGEILYK